MKELRPVSDDISTAADRLENTTVRVVSDGVSGIVYFGNATWNALDIDSASSSLAPAPAAPKQVLALSPLQVVVPITWQARNLLLPRRLWGLRVHHAALSSKTSYSHFNTHILNW